MTIIVTREGDAFIARFPFSYETKDIVKNAGFRYDPTQRLWYTRDALIASKLNPSLAANAVAQANKALDASRATNANLSIPCNEGLEYLGYQKAGIAYAMARRNTLIGDEMGCVDGDAIIHINRAGNGQQMTLATLHKQWQRWKSWNRPITTKMRALCDGELRQHEIRDVVFQGNKPVVRVTLTSGKTIRVTPDHEIAGPDNQWTAASDLNIGDQILTNGVAACLRCGTTENVATYRYAKFRGHCKECIYRYLRTDKWNEDGKHLDKDGYVRVGKQWDHPRQHNGVVPEHILVMESHLGRFLELGEEIHHRNENPSDNDLGNLELITRSEHHRRHRKHLHLHGGTNLTGTVRFLPVVDTVAEITEDGNADVYDIVMQDPHRNFVANGIIVHNCGKTIQALGMINSDPSIRSVLVICPASIKLNWQREAEKWLVRPMTIGIANGVFPTTDMVIINYDILAKHREAIFARRHDLLIADECHYVKNPKAQRTKLLLGSRRDKLEPIPARRRVFMTGTPIVNRPVELWPIVQALDPDDLGANFMKYTSRYCGAYRSKYGRVNTGASNLQELQQRLRTKFMVRRLKVDVLSELPPKRRQVIVLPQNGTTDLIDQENSVSRAVEAARVAVIEAEVGGNKAAYEAAVASLREAESVAFETMSTLRRLIAEAKVPHVIGHVQECLEATDKVVLFCHHLSVAHALREAFPDCAYLTGETKIEDRQAAVDRFQSDPKCRVFVGGIKAAGVGITLTASSHVVFAELDWTPAGISQAEDRCHRIGQVDSVLVQHLVFDGSLDARIAKTVLEKQDVIDRALDVHIAPVKAPEPMTPSFQQEVIAKAIEERPITAPSAPIPQYPNIRAMFDHAVSNGAVRAMFRAGGLTLSLAPKWGNNPGAVYVKRGEDYLGKLMGLEYRGKPAPELTIIEMDPHKAAIAYGTQTGECACCGAELTDPISIARRIGPICAAKFGF